MCFVAPDDYIYSKVTTISPLYVIVNNTSHMLVVAQEGTQGGQTQVIKQRERGPWHWCHKDLPKRVQVRIEDDILSPLKRNKVNFAYSSKELLVILDGFPISELGTLAIACYQSNRVATGSQK